MKLKCKNYARNSNDNHNGTRNTKCIQYFKDFTLVSNFYQQIILNLSIIKIIILDYNNHIGQI